MTSNFSGVGKFSNGKIEGIATIDGGRYEDLNVDGICTIKGDIEARNFDVNGMMTVEGGITCDKFDCDGMATVSGNIKAKEVDVEGMVTIGGTKLEADKIECDGIITMDGEISADKIEADGFIKAREIVGDHIKIKSHRKSFFFTVFTPQKLKFSSVDLIEATTIDLRWVKAETVRGHDVKIGEECRIERLDYTGKLSVDPSATIGTVTGPDQGK